MDKALENLFDIKGMKEMVAVVFIIVIAILVINSFPGQNEPAIQAIVGVLNSYILAVAIAGTIALIAFVIWLFRKFGNNGGMV